METQVLYGPAYATCVVTLRQGEQIRTDSGAMVAMDPSFEVATNATGGFMRSLSRSVLGGESFFQNTYLAQADASRLMLAPSLAGDIMVYPLDGEMIVQSGSYLASEIAIAVDSTWGGAKTFFGGEGLFMLRCAGQGTLILASYGAIHHFALAAGQRMTADTGHLVAFSASMTYQIRKFGNWRSTLLGGEGLVMDVTGPGDLYIQTRSPQSFINWLSPRLPRDTNN